MTKKRRVVVAGSIAATACFFISSRSVCVCTFILECGVWLFVSRIHIFLLAFRAFGRTLPLSLATAAFKQIQLTVVDSWCYCCCFSWSIGLLFKTVFVFYSPRVHRAWKVYSSFMSVLFEISLSSDRAFSGSLQS